LLFFWTRILKELWDTTWSSPRMQRFAAGQCTVPGVKGDSYWGGRTVAFDSSTISYCLYVITRLVLAQLINQSILSSFQLSSPLLYICLLKHMPNPSRILVPARPQSKTALDAQPMRKHLLISGLVANPPCFLSGHVEWSTSVDVSSITMIQRRAAIIPSSLTPS
jgi:hypothetical protein